MGYPAHTGNSSYLKQEASDFSCMRFTVCRQYSFEACMDNLEHRIDDDVSKYSEEYSYTDLAELRRLYKDDDRFNPATVKRVVEMSSKLSVEDMISAMGKIVLVYNKKVAGAIYVNEDSADKVGENKHE